MKGYRKYLGNTRPFWTTSQGDRFVILRRNKGTTSFTNRLGEDTAPKRSYHPPEVSEPRPTSTSCSRLLYSGQTRASLSSLPFLESAQHSVLFSLELEQAAAAALGRPESAA